MTTHPPQRRRILIAGASVRAMVQSVQRVGGGEVIAADLFQDDDLGPATRCRLHEGYRNLSAAAERLEPDMWMYMGALENYPAIVEAVRVPLLGCRSETLRAVRDPWQLAAAMRHAGLPTVPLARTRDGLPANGTWLRKRIASAAGRMIDIVDPRMPAAPRQAIYFQRRVIGNPTSAVFVASGDDFRWLGATAQQVGVGDPDAGTFQYLGSLGPLSLDADRRGAWERIGAALVQRFSLRGLFGVDAIDDGVQLLPLEVNPRPTASVEVLERAAGWNAWDVHRKACMEGGLPSCDRSLDSQWAAKRILFADRPMTVTAKFLQWAHAQNESTTWPWLADLPALPGSFPRGAPLLTLLIGPSPNRDPTTLAQELEQRASQVRAALNP